MCNGCEISDGHPRDSLPAGDLGMVVQEHLYAPDVLHGRDFEVHLQQVL